MVDNNCGAGPLVALWKRLEAELGVAGETGLAGPGLLVTFSPVTLPPDQLRGVLERIGVQVGFDGEVPAMLRGGPLKRLVSGSCDGVALLAELVPGATHATLELDLQNASADANGLVAESAFQVCDRVMGNDRATSDLVAGYLAHRLARARGKARTKLLAEIATVLADHLHDQAG
jgi:hypothetical protein